MSVSQATTSLLTAPSSQSQTFGERLSKLPEELIILILENILALPGAISKKDFWGGKCEWPGCLCENSDWEHVPGEELTDNNLVPLLSTPRPLPRLAQYVFYRSNTFHVCDPRVDMDWATRGIWLPPQRVRQWIRRLEIQIQIDNPQRRSFAYHTSRPGHDVMYLRQMQHAVEAFSGLRTLRLMFEAAFVTEDDMLQVLDRAWSALEPFCFRTPELVLEACSAYPAWCDDSEPSSLGGLVRDEHLERLLAKHVSATGDVQCCSGKEDWVEGVCQRPRSGL